MQYIRGKMGYIGSISVVLLNGQWGSGDPAVTDVLPGVAKSIRQNSLIGSSTPC